MESRRLRLLLVAYLRGYLNPDLAQGLRSRLRKEVILSAVNDELQVQSAELFACMRSAVLNVVKPESRATFLNETDRYIQLANDLRYHYGKPSMEKQRNALSNNQLIDLFRVLDDTGTLKAVMNAPRIENIV